MAAPTPSPPRKHLLHAIICLLVAFVVVAAGYGYFYLHDASTRGDDDLMTEDIVVPDDQNGIIQLRKLDQDRIDFVLFAKQHGLNADEAGLIALGQQKNDALVSDFLIQAQPVFSEIDRVLALPHFSYQGEVGPATMLPELQIEIKIMRALSLSAQNAQERGDYAEAVRDAVRLRLLAKRMEECHSMSMQFLTNASVADMAGEIYLRLLDDQALPADEREALAASLSPPISWKESGKLYLSADYRLLDGLFDYMKNLKNNSAGKIENPWLWLNLRENNTRRLAAPYYRALVQSLDGSYRDIDIKKIKALLPDPLPEKPSGFSLTPNALGRYFWANLVAPATDPLALIYKSETLERLLETGCALRKYYDANKALPPSLDRLVPKYISAVPLDPFTDQPLHYNPARGLVYSVGTSLVDNGGSNLLADTTGNSDGETPFNDIKQPTLQLTLKHPSALKTTKLKPIEPWKDTTIKLVIPGKSSPPATPTKIIEIPAKTAVYKEDGRMNWILAVYDPNTKRNCLTVGGTGIQQEFYISSDAGLTYCRLDPGGGFIWAKSLLETSGSSGNLDGLISRFEAEFDGQALSNFTRQTVMSGVSLHPVNDPSFFLAGINADNPGKGVIIDAIEATDNVVHLELTSPVTKHHAGFWIDLTARKIVWATVDGGGMNPAVPATYKMDKNGNVTEAKDKDGNIIYRNPAPAK